MIALFALSLVAQEPPAPAPAVSEFVRVAVMDLKLSDDVSPRVGRIVADNLVAEIRKLQGVTVVSMEELRTMLEAEADRQLLGCSSEDSCLAEITEALGADTVLTGSIATLDDARVFSLRRLDQKNAKVVAEVNERLVPAQGEELLAAVGPAIEKLFAELPLRAGETRGVPPERARLLNPPPLPVWSTLVVAGVAAASLAGGVGLGFAAQNEADGLQEQIDSSAATPVQGSLLVKREARVGNLALAANALYVAASAGALATVGMALFTDWTGASE